MEVVIQAEAGNAALFYSLEESGFPTHLLPDVAEAGTIAGQTTHQWFGIPQGTEVGVALGDLQCSVYSCMSRSTDAGESGMGLGDAGSVSW